jgi:hypothetical protein
MRRGAASSHTYFHQAHHLSNIQRSLRETNTSSTFIILYCIISLFQTCKLCNSVLWNLIHISCKRFIIYYLIQHFAQSIANYHLSFTSHLHASTSTRSSTERYVQRHKNILNSVKVAHALLITILNIFSSYN